MPAMRRQRPACAAASEVPPWTGLRLLRRAGLSHRRGGAAKTLEGRLHVGVDVVGAAVDVAEGLRGAEDARAVRHADAEISLAQFLHLQQVAHAEIGGRIEGVEDL